MTVALLLVAEPFNPISSPQGTVPVYLSDVGFNSLPGDSPANTYFPERLLEAFSFSIRLFGGDDAYPRGQGSASFGDISIQNGDGRYDDLLDMGWTGRRIRLIRTPKYGSFSGGELVFDGTCGGISVNDDTIVLALKSKAELLNRPVLQTTFAGTGGIEGDSELEGQRRPLALGRCFNIPAIPLISASAIYFLSRGPILTVTAVRDKGVALVFDADYPDYSALSSATPAPGEYATCLALGLVKLGAAAEGEVRADVYGYTTGGSSGYAETAADIVELLLTEFGPLTSSDLDLTAFSALNALQSSPQNLYLPIDSQGTVAEALDWLLAGIGSWWIVGGNGKVTLGRLSAPSGTAAVTINAKDDVLQDIGIRRLIPPWRWQLGWRRNWGPQDQGSLADGVGPNLKRSYSQTWSVATRPSADTGSVILERELSAEELFVETGFAVGGNATAEANRLLALHAERQIVTLPMAKLDAGKSGDPFAAPLGQVVELAGWNRFGWGSSKKFILIGVSTDQSGANVTWELWG